MSSGVLMPCNYGDAFGRPGIACKVVDHPADRETRAACHNNKLFIFIIFQVESVP